LEENVVEIMVSQSPMGNCDAGQSGFNASYIDLPKTFALGWGYDYSIDYADIAGIRGQVFDGAALHNDFGDDVVESENYATTKLLYVSEHSVEDLQQSMSAKVTGSVDLYIARAKVSVEYQKQINETKERLFIWCRDARTVRMAHFSNEVDIFDEKVVNWDTTSAFRQSVKNDTPENFVKKFGTHVVVSSVLGGKLDYYFTVSQDVKTETEGIITTVNVKVLCWESSSSSVDERSWTEIKKDFIGNFVVAGGGAVADKLNYEFKTHASKGEPVTNSELYDAWYDCFRYPSQANPDNLIMVDFEVLPIWLIVESLDPYKAEQIENYIRSHHLTPIK